MNDYQRVQDRDELDNRIFDTLSQCLGTDTVYTLGNYLYVNPESLEVEILIGIEKTSDDMYPVQMFFQSQDNKELEVDCDATYAIASKYVFVG